MIIFKNELPIDHEQSIQNIVHTWAKEIYGGDCEDAWNSVMEHLQSEDLYVEISGDAIKLAFPNYFNQRRQAMSDAIKFVITKYMSDEQKQDVGEIIADVLMNLDPDTKSAIDYYGSDFTWDIVIGAKKNV